MTVLNFKFAKSELISPIIETMKVSHAHRNYSGMGFHNKYKERLTFWQNHRIRQIIHRQAEQLWKEYEASETYSKQLKEMASKLVLRLDTQTDYQTERKAIPEAEVEFFRRELTEGDMPYRAMFWRHVEMIAHSVQPTDLQRFRDCEYEYRRDVERIDALYEEFYKNRDPNDREVSAAELQAWQLIKVNDPEFPIYDWRASNQLNYYARLYLAGGAARNAWCEPSNNFRHLRRPQLGSIQSRSVLGKSLEFWRYMGISSLKQARIPALSNDYYRGQTPARFETVVFSKDFPSPDNQAQIQSMGRAFFETYPAEHKALFASMKQRLYALSNMYAAVQTNGEVGAKFLDHHERDLFGFQVTSGRPVARRIFWRAATEEDVVFELEKMDVHELVFRMAERHLVRTQDPQGLCHLIDYGRGGLSTPIPKGQFEATVPEHQRGFYKPLFQWLIDNTSLIGGSHHEIREYSLTISDIKVHDRLSMP